MTKCENPQEAALCSFPKVVASPRATHLPGAFLQAVLHGFELVSIDWWVLCYVFGLLPWIDLFTYYVPWIDFCTYLLHRTRMSKNESHPPVNCLSPTFSLRPEQAAEPVAVSVLAMGLWRCKGDDMVSSL